MSPRPGYAYMISAYWYYNDTHLSRQPMPGHKHHDSSSLGMYTV